MENKNTAPTKTRNTKMIKVALFCISAIVIFYIGANFLKGIDIFGKKTYYYAVIDDASGLTTSTPVLVNGYKIGKITNLAILNDNPFSVCAEMFIMQDINIPKDSRAEIISTDLLGGKAFSIVLGTSREMAKNNDTLTSKIVIDGLDMMIVKLNRILSSVDTLGNDLKNVLHEDGGVEKLKNALTNIESASKDLKGIFADNKPKIDKLLSDVTAFGNTLSKAAPQLQEILANFDNITDSLVKADIASVIADLDKTIMNINEVAMKIDRGDGDIAKLLNNDALYTNLEGTTQNLTLLIKDIKENPKRYINITVFGGKTKQEKLDEKEAKKKAKEEKK